MLVPAVKSFKSNKEPASDELKIFKNSVEVLKAAVK
jgi:hypothetical protein